MNPVPEAPTMDEILAAQTCPVDFVWKATYSPEPSASACRYLSQAGKLKQEPASLSTLSILPKLKEIGVSVIKAEGRQRALLFLCA